MRAVAGAGEDKAAIVPVRLLFVLGESLAAGGSRGGRGDGGPGGRLGGGKRNRRAIAEPADDGSRLYPLSGGRRQSAVV